MKSIIQICLIFGVMFLFSGFSRPITSKMTGCGSLITAKAPPVCNITLITDCCIYFAHGSNVGVKNGQICFKMTGTVTGGTAYLKFEILTGSVWMPFQSPDSFYNGRWTPCFPPPPNNPPVPAQKYRISLVNGLGPGATPLANASTGTAFPYVFDSYLWEKCLGNARQ